MDHPDWLKKLDGFTGCFALASSKNPQSITIDITRDTISILGGIKPNATIVIRMDFNKPGKPKVEGLWRHPLLALNVSKLLEFPSVNWIDAAGSFWEKNHDYPGFPKGITIHSKDENQEHNLGQAPYEVYISGSSDQIAEVFDGNNVFVQAVISGRLKARSSFEHATILSDVTLQMMMGER